MGAAVESIQRFFAQGIHLLGDRLGPINWQFMEAKKFDAEGTADFTYARLMQTREKPKTGFTGKELDAWAAQAQDWARRGDVYLYVISGAKVNNPAAAMALIERVGADGPPWARNMSKARASNQLNEN